MGPGIANAVKDGQTKVQIGSNTNLCDWTYVDNVAKAHILAADKLVECSQNSKLASSSDMLAKPLRNISLTSGARRVPTSKARPLGPVVTPPPHADEITEAWERAKIVEERRVVRSKYDQFSPAALNRMKQEDEDFFRVDGQVFIITNGEPIYFWDVAHTFMLGFGAPRQHADHPPVVIPKAIGHVFGVISEWLFWFVGRTPAFTSVRADYMCASRYYNFERARRVLGYEPDVSVKEGIERTVEVCSIWLILQHIHTNDTFIVICSGGNSFTKCRIIWMLLYFKVLFEINIPSRTAISDDLFFLQ